ncbi:hypothetical protein TGAMA5MH_06385 [Trichoderma gamsii]|uniref:Uncharacterized protein n=1 Tax=Trichoderma gamsii TaxID=398673 RepID=A0A2K0T8E4_9HYPO|nr:hypothetical protein TGAMA5MH_06385 [Trichoderma gamsii]
MSVIYDRDPCGLEVRPPEEGLEVWAPDVGGLEVSTREQVEQALEVFCGCDDLEAVDPSANGFVRVNTESFIEKPEQESSDEHLRKKQWLILTLAGVAVLFIILATVLGIVLGLRLNNSSSKTPTETPRASATPPATSSKPANAVYATSGIGVTGWWTGPSSFTIRLIYQDQHGYLRLMRYHSGDGTWSTLAIFSDANAKLGSPIAASSYNIPFYCFSPITSSNNFTQVEIFYLNNENILQEWYFREQDSAYPSAQTFSGSGPMSPNGWKASPNTRLAAYWPSVIFQDGNNQVQEAYDANLTWARSSKGLKSRNGSALAEVPSSVLGGRFGGDKILYQRDDQKLILEGRTNLTNKLSIGAPPIAIPPNSPMGAFTVPRYSNSSDGAMNTYILWQNSSDTLLMTWEDDDTGWRTSSTPTFLGRPDNGTGISCLTATLWTVASLPSDYSTARCYYLMNGQIREVKYDGSNWAVIGNVLLD